MSLSPCVFKYLYSPGKNLVATKWKRKQKA